MSTRNRVLLGILLVFAAGVAWLLYGIISDLEPRYREAAEEPLIDTSRVLAALLATDIHDGVIDPGRFRAAFKDVYRQRFKAQVYALQKTAVDLRVYVTDDKGIVLFDSTGRDEGLDYSKWRDVQLTLAGEYGARTTRNRREDPKSSVMFVASPVLVNGDIVGVLSVGKPTRNLKTFATIAQHKIELAGTTSVIGLIVVALLAAILLTRPFSLVSDYLRLARNARNMPLPRLRRTAIGTLGAAYDEMRDALAGRNYVEEYVQGLTHEIKSPLSAIRGAVELLQEDMPAADRDRFLANIRVESERLQVIVDKLLELSALEKRRGLAEVAEVRVDELLGEVVQTTSTVAGQRGVTIKPHDGAGVVVAGDRFLLHRALVNLVQNAIEFSPAGAEVELAVQQDRHDTEIAVLDRGPGLPAYAKAKVFDRFYSLPRPDTHRKGTGLGLSFVKEIAELHRGSITLDNRPDGGLKAVLRLPRET